MWHIDGGTARHDAVAWGYAKQAAKRGVEIHQLTEVQELVIENGTLTAVKTNR
ncbi:sarcosine oxidase, beta subunit, partial [Pseudomonas syringae pv. actinidiae ICMP 19096]